MFTLDQLAGRNRKQCSMGCLLFEVRDWPLSTMALEFEADDTTRARGGVSQAFEQRVDLKNKEAVDEK